MVWEYGVEVELVKCGSKAISQGALVCALVILMWIWPGG